MDCGFSLALWPEISPPAKAVNCQKCELCKQRSRVIWGEGNPQAPIIVILDNPGAREDKEGKEFVCGARQTLQAAACQAGLKMEDMYITYLLKCRPIRRYNKAEARGICKDYLLEQIEIQQPQLAFCLGDTASQWFFGDRDAQVKFLRGKWHEVRGLPTAVSYHPLAVRRRPNLFYLFRQDWELLAQRLLGEKI